ncbi:chemotaxis protein CheW [Sporosarcina ureae]|uniref:Chemotaxis protein CheW n=1 Tax=Sporosarcina ureae TaxID=1571 RepID=A0ABN4YU78_SPOUR|nr:chemotaxis protein CheW [Sporosarcina ureae]ARF15336.1 chemotaxis protein CheW [Sporosarcina ureae]
MTKATEVSDMKVIVFQLMNKEYAIGLDVVESIEKSLSITRVPRMPSYVKGVLNLRGVVTPVVDLRERFDMEYKEFDETSCIIIVSHAGSEVGLIVDDANDVMDVPISAIGPQPEVVGSVESEFISGVAKVGKRLLVMLNLEKVLQPIKKGNADEF